MSKIEKLINDFRQHSIAYNADCNTRFLGRGATDTKREKLKSKAEKSFEDLMSEVRKQLGTP